MRILITWGAVILILSVIIALFLGSGGSVSTEDLTAVQTKIEKLGQRLSSLEGIEAKLSQIEKQGKSLQKSIARTERSGISLAKRLDKLSKRVDALQKKVASLTPQSVAKPKPALPTKGRYHKVRAGESYYRIAQRYGLTVEELLRINNLRKNQVIYPGQRLLIGPAGQ
jgi:membrane-bound lytic murein transglycosylase D